MPSMETDPKTFVPDAVAGFCDLHRDFVQPVPGGVVRSRESRAGKVALVIGGGSGHYPAFLGYVGPGLADGAVVGNIFASPSARQVRNVGSAANRGGGVLLAYGNYAGDVLNFELGAERLRDEEIEVMSIAVTDDVASAPAGESELRRGVAGDLIVFKVAGAAAERGDALPDVAEVARAANAVTRSLGVAFSGCTVPGSSEPLFSLPPGKMGVGLGVHGEPGIAEEALCSAPELAAVLVDRLLDEVPHGAGERPVALLNGLGATKYEELFQLWHHIRRRLRDHGVEPAAVKAGELITSLDMAGCSLTLSWLDPSGVALWDAPVQTPVFRHGAVIATRPAPEARVAPIDAFPDPDGAASTSAEVRMLERAFAEVAGALEDAEEDLNHLDAVAGDGDHGRSMVAGASAAHEVVVKAAAAGAGLSSALAAAADAWCDASGGTSGALWSAGLRAAAATLKDRGGSGRAARAAQAALSDIVRLGKVKPGDKTVVDALAPLVESLESENWAAAASAAAEAAAQTAELTPRVGRARPLAERSVGHADPGASSLAICARAVAQSLEQEEDLDA